MTNLLLHRIFVKTFKPSVKENISLSIIIATLTSKNPIT